MVALVFGACSRSSESPSANTGFLNLDGQPQPKVTLTVFFRPAATKLDMATLFERLSDALLLGGLADAPAMDGFYEEYRLVLSWASADAGRRGEARVREILATEALVERIEVSRR